MILYCKISLASENIQSRRWNNFPLDCKALHFCFTSQTDFTDGLGLKTLISTISYPPYHMDKITWYISYVTYDIVYIIQTNSFELIPSVVWLSSSYVNLILLRLILHHHFRDEKSQSSHVRQSYSQQSSQRKRTHLNS